jgi:hypothetical protein
MRLIESTKHHTKWEIEQRDKGTVVLLSNGVDRKLTNKDIGYILVCGDNGKDKLEDPLPVEEFDEELTDDLY